MRLLTPHQHSDKLRRKIQFIYFQFPQHSTTVPGTCPCFFLGIVINIICCNPNGTSVCRTGLQKSQETPWYIYLQYISDKKYRLKKVHKHWLTWLNSLVLPLNVWLSILYVGWVGLFRPPMHTEPKKQSHQSVPSLSIMGSGMVLMNQE